MSPSAYSLSGRFFLLLLLFLVVCALGWGFIAARSAGKDFEQIVALFLADGHQEVDQILAQGADAQAELLDQAVLQLSAKLATEFEDVPFDIFEGRQELLLEYLQERLTEAQQRNDDNAKIIVDLLRSQSRATGQKALAAMADRQEIRGQAIATKQRRKFLIWGGAFLGGLGLLIGFVFRQTVAKPLADARVVMQEFRAGRHDRRLVEDGSEEIGLLARSFNAMADEVQGHQEDLERNVSEKTAALRESLVEQRETNDRLRLAMHALESTQKQLVESEKTAALGTMARGMAHEFNNVLGGIAGCAADLAEDLEDEEAQEVLEVIHKTSRRALVITENLLSFSRGSAHGKSLADLAAIVRETVALVDPEATRRGVELIISGDIGSPFVTDGRGLQQVLLNLLINALQASQSGGKIKVVCSCDHKEGWRRIEVKDEGSGITAEHLSHLFEPFFSTKEDEEGGTGLGLSVARGVMESLGGSIQARSDGLGKGSQFEIEIPNEADHHD